MSTLWDAACAAGYEYPGAYEYVSAIKNLYLSEKHFIVPVGTARMSGDEQLFFVGMSTNVAWEPALTSYLGSNASLMRRSR